MGSTGDPLLLPPPGNDRRRQYVFVAESGDIERIRDLQSFCREFMVESRKLWYLGGPAIFTSICQYSLGAVTQVIAGHVGTMELAAVTVENSVIAGFSFGVMLGMGSALETLCGQAYGAGEVEMLGIYLQRSWVILACTATVLTVLYVLAGPLLHMIGQQPGIAASAGEFSVWMIPQLFAYAMNFPIAKFLQAQSRMLVMTAVSLAVLVVHAVASWVTVIVLGWGLPAAAVTLNVSWWLVVGGQLAYILAGGCGPAWSGFSMKAFKNLCGFVRLSVASAVMICLEVWYFMALILFAGYLKQAEIAVDAMSVCFNIFGWAIMIAMGSNAATSVRVSNELGAGHPRTAKFSLVVAVIITFFLGLIISSTLLLTRKQYPSLFTNSLDVQKLIDLLTPLLAASVTISNVQPVLSGAAVGAGWQAFVAYVNVGCYYLFGIPLGLLLGYKFDFGVQGIWYGMLSGTIVQTLILFWMVYQGNWAKEASMAVDRIKRWGGETKSAEREAILS